MKIIVIVLCSLFALAPAYSGKVLLETQGISFPVTVDDDGNMYVNGVKYERQHETQALGCGYCKRNSDCADCPGDEAPYCMVELKSCLSGEEPGEDN